MEADLLSKSWMYANKKLGLDFSLDSVNIMNIKNTQYRRELDCDKVYGSLIHDMLDMFRDFADPDISDIITLVCTS